jgi:predicted GIY-YIG superfamily endonuclease
VEARPVYVYALRSNAEAVYRYVGSTVNWHLRLSAHRSAPGAFALNEWRAAVQNAGQSIELDVLEVSDEDNAWSVEMQWMARLRQEGHPLLNKKQRVCPEWR